MRIGEAGTAAKESPFRSSTAVNAPLAHVCGQPIGTFVMAQRRLNATGKCRDLARLGEFLMLGVVSLRDQRHSSLLSIAKGEDNRRRRTPGLSATGAKARGLGASAREARGDVGHAPDVAGSQSPTSPAACDRGRNNSARTALGARSSGLAALMPTGSGESTGGRPVGRPRCARRALGCLPAKWPPSSTLR
jgi:hypothetical protein